MIQKFTISICLIFFVMINVNSQTWIRIYGGTPSIEGHRIFVHYDKGYILSGQQFEGNNSFGWLMKTDINGNERWSKSYGKNGKVNSFYSSCLTSDGGLICIGGSDKVNSNCTDPLILKLNACGDKEWCKIFNSTNCNSFGIDITTVPGGGYMALLQDWINSPDVWLFRLDSTGEIIWTQNYVANSNIFWSPEAQSLKRNSDYSFLITGNSYSPDSLIPKYLLLKIFLVKVNISGNILFETPWGTNNGIISDPYFSTEDNKHKIYTAGRRARQIAPYGDSPCLFKTTANGYPINYTDLRSNSYLGISTTINWFQDSSLVIGSVWQGLTGVDTTAVIKTDSNGNILNTKILLPTESLSLLGSDITSDNKLVIEGFNFNTTYIFKLNSDLAYDSIYTQNFIYDSLCPHPIISDTISMDDCMTVVVGIDDPIKHPEKTKLHIYPNPAKNAITIEMPQYLTRQSTGYGITATTYYHQWNTTTLEIYDLFGKLMYSKEIPKKTEKVDLDVSTWHEGMYVARVVFMNEIVAGAKFVVE